MSPRNRAVDAMIAATPYRTVEPIPKSPECGKLCRVIVGDGFVHRAVLCPTPGWLARLISKIKENEVWECDRCGKKYRWQYCSNHWHWEPITSRLL